MIKVTSRSGSITVKGHAGYAKHGDDIVCAAVSFAAQNLIQSLKELTSDEIKYDISPGSVDIEYRNLSEQAQVLVDSFFIGIDMIAKTFPLHVQLSKH